MTHATHTPEMGQDMAADTQIEATVAHYRGYYVKTHLELKGRGIKPAGSTTNAANPRNCYHVTEIAFQKLCNAYKVSTLSLLD